MGDLYIEACAKCAPISRAAHFLSLLVLRQLLIRGLACRFGSGQRAANHFLQPQYQSLTRH